MRVGMGTSVRFFVVLALACLSLSVIAADREERDGVVVVHKVVPSKPIQAESVHHGVEHGRFHNERPKLQWSFNPLNPFQTFEVAKAHEETKHGLVGRFFSNMFGNRHHHHEGEHRHEKHARGGVQKFVVPEELDGGGEKAGLGAKFGSFFSNIVGPNHHQHGHEQSATRPFRQLERHHGWFPWGRHHHHHDHEHHHEGEHKDHYHHHQHLEEAVAHRFKRARFTKEEGHISRVGGFLTSMRDQIKSWGVPVGERKAPTLQSVTEPLDVRSLVRHASPKSSCSLREKLYSVFHPVLMEMSRTSISTDKDVPTADVITSNLKKLMGDSIQLGIVKNVCDVSTMSSCEQEFCDVFLSHPKSGILMALRVLSINPLKAAVNPEGVPEGSMILSQNSLDILHQLKQTRHLAHIVFMGMEQLLDENTQKIEPNLKERVKIFFTKTFHGEQNTCKACLQQEIFRMKRLAKRAMVAACETPADPTVGAACKFVKENKFIAKTMFAYKFKLWDKASVTCNRQKSCNSASTTVEDGSAHRQIGLGNKQHQIKTEGLKPQFEHLDVGHIRHPRVLEITHPMMSKEHRVQPQMNCRQWALHRAAMLRGRNLEFLASQLMKATNSVSQNRDIGPLVVVEFDFHLGPTVPHMLEFISVPRDEFRASQPGERPNLITVPEAFGSSQKGVTINQKPEFSVSQDATQLEMGPHVFMDQTRFKLARLVEVLNQPHATEKRSGEASAQKTTEHADL